jgi:hypothetical protein
MIEAGLSYVSIGRPSAEAPVSAAG